MTDETLDGKLLAEKIRRYAEDLRAARYEVNRQSVVIQSYRRTGDLELLHPEVRDKFKLLAGYLEKSFKEGHTDTLFKPFETFRSPIRQRELYSQTPRVTKAKPWHSAHQYGLATDFVPILNGNWNWHEKNDYAFLRDAAKLHGLSVPYAWDLVHVEHPLFKEVRRVFITE